MTDESGNAMSKAILVSVALAPLIFLGCIVYFRTGRDLTTVFLVGAAILLVVATGMMAIGYWKGKSQWTTSGVTALMLLLLPVATQCSGLYWYGQEATALTLLVKDEGGTPISHALVRLFQHEDNERATRGVTDAGGNVTLVHTFTAIGTDSLSQKTGVVYLWNVTLVVDAKGYVGIRERLDRYSPSVWDLYALPLPEVEVRLRKKK